LRENEQNAKNNIMKILILAGGFATRLWPITEKRAKPLLQINNQTILNNLLGKISRENSVVILTNSLFLKDFEKEILKFSDKLKIDIFCEDAIGNQGKMGALKAVSMTIKELEINEDIQIWAGDNLLSELGDEKLFPGKNEAIIATTQVDKIEDACHFGVIKLDKNDGNKIIDFVEKPAQPQSKIISTGFFGISKELIPFIHQAAEKHADNLGELITFLLKEKVVIKNWLTTKNWFDVGSFETYLSAHRTLQKEKVLLGKNAIMKNCSFRGKVMVGENCRLENCHLMDTIIYPNNKMKNCQISHSVIDENCRLENLDLNQKMIRAGTILQGEENDD